MDKAELIQFLKDNLVIEVTHDKHCGFYESDSIETKVKIKIGDEVISESYDTFSLPG